MTGRYRMRRHARRLRRYGLQPITLINPGDPLPEPAAVTMVRWAWRYRSELAPVVFSLTAALAASFLHRTHPRLWPMVAALAASATVSLLFGGERIGLATRIERVYAATVAAATGAWLATATVLGPSQRPLPQVLFLAGLVLAVPWWAHRRRRAKVRVERKLEAWPEIAQTIGLAGSRVMSAVVDLWGWRARFALARGQTIEDVIAKLPAIESALGTYRGAARVYPTDDDLANRFELRILDKDPHVGAIAWPGPSVASITEPIDLGPFEDAAPARVLFLRRHGLFGGVSGSGKSGGLNVLMANLSACADVVIWAVDLKKGMELAPWVSCIDRLATTPAEARALLRDAVAVLEARAAGFRPALDDGSRRAIKAARDRGVGADVATAPGQLSQHRQPAEQALWLALCVAPDDGADIAELMRASGTSRQTPNTHQPSRDDQANSTAAAETCLRRRNSRLPGIMQRRLQITGDLVGWRLLGEHHSRRTDLVVLLVRSRPDLPMSGSFSVTR